MTAEEAYILAKKAAAAAVSGVESMRIVGNSLEIECKNGDFLTYNFPLPKDGKSPIKAEFNEENHLIFTLSDMSKIDAGPMPGGMGEGSGVLEEELVTNVTVGGCAAGTRFEEGTSLEAILRKILIQEVPPTIKITVNPISGLFLKGTSRTLKYVISTISRGSSELVSIDLYANVDKIATLNCGSQNSYTYTLANPIEFTEDTDFKAVLTYKMSNGIPKTVTSPLISYRFCPYSYYGAVDSIENLTSDDITGLATHEVIGAKGTTASFTCDNQYLIYAYPKSFGKLSKIKDDNFELTWDLYEVPVTDEYGVEEDYYVYTNGSKTEVDSYPVTFA